MNELFSMIAIDGDVLDWADNPCVPYLSYHNLSWDKAVELVRLSFSEGYVCVLWKAEDDEVGGTNDG